MSDCQHIRTAKTAHVTPSGKGCKECLETGDSWVHLRECLECGHIGCCDNSKNRHATRHWKGVHHPVIRSFEPGESWLYCYPDDLFVE